MDSSAGPQQQRPNKPSMEEPQLLAAAKHLRSTRGVKSREAVEGDRRVEYFKGKRLMKALLSAADAKNPWAPNSPEQAAYLANRLLQAGFYHRSILARKGKLEPDFRQFFDPEAVYVWTWESPYYYYRNLVLGFAILLVLFMGATIQIWPSWMRMGVLYICGGLLGIYLGIMVLRLVIFCVCWVLGIYPGYWLFPNLLRDETLIGPFIPLWGTGEEGKPVKRTKKQKESIINPKASGEGSSGDEKDGSGSGSEKEKPTTVKFADEDDDDLPPPLVDDNDSQEKKQQ